MNKYISWHAIISCQPVVCIGRINVKPSILCEVYLDLHTKYDKHYRFTIWLNFVWLPKNKSKIVYVLSYHAPYLKSPWTAASVGLQFGRYKTNSNRVKICTCQFNLQIFKTCIQIKLFFKSSSFKDSKTILAKQQHSPKANAEK